MYRIEKLWPWLLGASRDVALVNLVKLPES